MREALFNACLPWPRHPSLAYERTGVLRSADYEGADDDRSDWLDRLAATPVDAHYANFYGKRWEPTLRSSADVRLVRVELLSRLLIGHGNPSTTEVGITLHHTWAVPMIPGSAIKGLLAHYIADHFGGDEHEREPWRGVHWGNNGSIERGPGRMYARLFGAPDSKADPTGAHVGEVVFHDALYVPGSCSEDKPFARDVLTVHQPTYYNEGRDWPNDHDSPNPVAFLTVRPGAEFLLAVEGPPGLTDLALRLVLAAFEEWGIGGKTSLGYGRLKVADAAKPQAAVASPREMPAKRAADREAPSATLSNFLDWMKKQTPVAHMLEQVLPQWRTRLLALSVSERRLVATRLGAKVDNCKRAGLKARIDAFIAELKREA